VRLPSRWRLVGGAAAADVVDGAGGEADPVRSEEGDELGDLLRTPTRFIGIRLVMYASTSGAVPSFIGVAMTAGAMALTSTPVVASSLPADLVRPMTAALDAE
jgi:hypothetical protein